MIFSKTPSSKTIISIDDQRIRYISLAKNKDGFYIEKYDTAEIESGVIENGEILRADFLKKVLQRIAKKIPNTSMHLLLPHELFHFDLHAIPKKKKKASYKKVLKKYLSQHKHDISWARTRAYQYDIFDHEKELRVLFRTLDRDMYSGYEYVFKQAGLSIVSTHSNVVSFAQLLPQKGRVDQVFVQSDKTSILGYIDGMYIGGKEMLFSRNQCVSEIKKHIDMSDQQATKILDTYGVMRSHRDERVFKSLNKNALPVCDYLTKKQSDFRKKKSKKTKQSFPIYVHFDGLPIKGLLDKYAKNTKTDVRSLSVLSGTHTFHEVLSLHKRDSYQYESLIARGLGVFGE